MDTRVDSATTQFTAFFWLSPWIPVSILLDFTDQFFATFTEIHKSFLDSFGERARSKRATSHGSLSGRTRTAMVIDPFDIALGLQDIVIEQPGTQDTASTIDGQDILMGPAGYGILVGETGIAASACKPLMAAATKAGSLH